MASNGELLQLALDVLLGRIQILALKVEAIRLRSEGQFRPNLLMSQFRLDALETNPTLMEVKTQVGDSYKWSFNGKMKSIVIEDDADYTFKAVLNSSENPSLLLKKADIVFKK